MCPGVLQIQVEGISLHVGAGELQHVARIERETSGVFEDLARLEFIEITPVLGMPHLVQLKRNFRCYFLLFRQLQGKTHGFPPRYRRRPPARDGPRKCSAFR